MKKNYVKPAMQEIGFQQQIICLSLNNTTANPNVIVEAPDRDLDFDFEDEE